MDTSNLVFLETRWLIQYLRKNLTDYSQGVHPFRTWIKDTFIGQVLCFVVAILNFKYCTQSGSTRSGTAFTESSQHSKKMALHYSMWLIGSFKNFPDIQDSLNFSVPDFPLADHIFKLKQKTWAIWLSLSVIPYDEPHTFLVCKK